MTLARKNVAISTHGCSHSLRPKAHLSAGRTLGYNLVLSRTSNSRRRIMPMMRSLLASLNFERDMITSTIAGLILVQGKRTGQFFRYRSITGKNSWSLPPEVSLIYFEYFFLFEATIRSSSIFDESVRAFDKQGHGPYHAHIRTPVGRPNIKESPFLET